MIKKGSVYFLVFALVFSLSFPTVNAQFKEGTCKNPNGETYCGGKSQLSKCYCDSACKGYADCCLDYQDICSTSDGGGAGKIPSICPQISPPYCLDGVLIPAGFDKNGCSLPPKCVPKCDVQLCKPFVCCDPVKGPCLEALPEKCEACSKDICKNLTVTCGNGICDPGESDYCPPCTTQPCPLAPCKLGTCQQDCQKPECVTDADCPALTCIKAPCPKNFCVNGKCAVTTCGNGICEEGEKTCKTICPQCAAGMPTAQCQCKETCTYKCPQDCQKPCPEVYKPVCGADGKTYSSSCTAEAAGVKIACDGQCPCKTQITKQDVINWINNNCYNTYTTTDSITGAIIKKVPIIIN